MEEQSSHYTVLARRFRPQTFAEVIGQQHVAQALQNAIQSGRVAHAYLFTGVRGVGKTSMARILAKALNCPNVESGVPCNACEICDGISAGNDVDVLEIDGASNRGIDDIRSLRANVSVKSMRTTYKLYIIDEVHMLTKEAFNALLKTLEEPPPNVKFVFCTTEANKVPDTILSRCQRFDFATIETSNIIERLRQIAESEGFEVEPAALEFVARRAAGSMRDSQSLFDQLLAFGEERITATDVHRLLGTADDDRLIDLVDALLARRTEHVLELFDGALGAGVQLGELTDQLLAYLRDLMVIAAGAESVALLSVSADNRGKLSQQAAQWGLQTITAALEILAETKSRMFRVSYGRALAELALIRLCLLEDLDRLDQLVRELKDGGRVTGGAVSGRGSGQTANRVPAREAKVEKKTPTVQRTDDKAAVEHEIPPVSVEFREGCEREFWSQVVSHVDDALMSHVKVVSGVAISGPNQLAVTFPGSYHFSRRYCEQAENLAKLESLAGKIAGRPVRIVLRLADVEESVAKPQAAERSSRRQPESTDDPFVQQAMSVFGATIHRVEESRSPSTQEE